MAIVAAKGLVDFRFASSSPSEPKKNKDLRKSDPFKHDGRKKGGFAGKTKPKDGHEKKSSGCFICDRPHRVRDCPKRTQLNAMVKETEVEPSMTEASTSRMNTLQLMNTLRNEVVCNDFNQGLMIMTVLVDGREVRAMLDTEATTNFLASHEVAHLGLKITAVGSKVMAVNSVSVGVQGAMQSSLRVGIWQKTVKLTVMPLDDFDLILGMKFFMA